MNKLINKLVFLLLLVSSMAVLLVSCASTKSSCAGVVSFKLKHIENA